jgi:hypothetical protein
MPPTRPYGVTGEPGPIQLPESDLCTTTAFPQITGRAIMCAERTVKEEAIMPQYVFLCQDCNKEFIRILHIADLES